MKFTTTLLVLAAACPCAFSQAVQPFSAEVTKPVIPLKPAKTAVAVIDCLSPEKAALWTVEPDAGQGEKPFSVQNGEGGGILRLKTDLMEPGRTTARILLPGDGPENGAIWAKNRANYISFLCRANKPADLTFHLLQRGKPAGTFQSRFSAEPGEWRRVILPIQGFGLQSFSKIAGLGFRVARAEKGTEIEIKDIAAGNTPFTDDSWKTHKHAVSLDGDWLFAVDPSDKGAEGKWFEAAFDDSAWQTLKSGQDWQAQGIENHGYGWYRQKIFVPKEFEGVPLKITLCPMPSDDDVWFNGQRIGGFRGEYKYTNWLTRSYTVPPSLIRYGENNQIALRTWGGHLTFIGNKSGLIKGPLVAELDPYTVKFRKPGGEAVAAENFDLSAARRGEPFEILFSFPADLAQPDGNQLEYRLADFTGGTILSGKSPLAVGSAGRAEAVVPIDPATAEKIYLRGRLQANLVVSAADGSPLYSGARALDRLSFAARDSESLPALPETLEETPYGRLKLVDEIDCSTPADKDPHPYMQSGFDKAQERMPPGSEVDVKVSEILGKKARESDFGWFAYRVGRGKLKPHTTYLLRFEYPEDKPRYAPIEVQTGQNFYDVGWKNGVGADDVYDNWPLSKKWQWYDVVVPLDDETTGTGGVGTGSSENGFWVYFLNKIKPGAYNTMWEGGPAISKIKLYEIDPEKNAPEIKRPKDLPNRVFSFDWERQADHDPEDLVRYAKLMGYSSISPIVVKWAFANYTAPLDGYNTVVIDDHSYWSNKNYDPVTGQPASSPLPGKKSQHERYLEATKKWGINYIPRFEWGGSLDLPEEARAIDSTGKPAKPNRFAQWSTDLLHPAAWEDLKKLMDHMVKPYVADNPQLTGVLWRIRSDRMPISYSKQDLELFSKETGTPLPAGGEAQQRAWAAGEMKAKYDAWWHGKRADFHKKLAALLQSYRPDLELYYYNWDGDKFGLINPDTYAWAFLSKTLKPAPDGGRAAYEKERDERKTFTAQDYISVMESGNFGEASKGVNRADYGIRPSLYADSPGIQIFAPSNNLAYADKPEYLNYFRTADGLAVSNVVTYDETNSRSINPKYEGHMMTPGGPAFSMALELLAYFHGDARTLNYTPYTYGRGFADAHRRFAQAFLALPAIPGEVIDQGDPDVKVRIYPAKTGSYIGVAHKGYQPKTLKIRIPAKDGVHLKNLVTGKEVPAKFADGKLEFEIESGPMELNAFFLE